MTGFEWFLLIVVVIVVPLTIAVVITLWTIDQANKRKRANRKDAQIGVKRKAALSPEEVEARKAARAEKQAAAEAEAKAAVEAVDNGSETTTPGIDPGFCSFVPPARATIIAQVPVTIPGSVHVAGICSDLWPQLAIDSTEEKPILASSAYDVLVSLHQESTGKQ